MAGIEQRMAQFALGFDYIFLACNIVL